MGFSLKWDCIVNLLVTIISYLILVLCWMLSVYE